MTNKEAIKILAGDYTSCGDCVGAHCGKCMTEAKVLAIVAISKQIPKKPVKLESWLSWTLWGCPSCGCMVDHDMTHTDHHCQCGQHLDWREVD